MPKQGHLQLVAHNLVQAGFEYLQRRRTYSSSGQPVPVHHHPQSKEVLPHVQAELLMLEFEFEFDYVEAKTQGLEGRHKS